MRSNSVTNKSYSIHILLGLSFCLLFSCTKKQETENADTTKLGQYYLQGQKLYEKNCSNCHQKNGTGLGLLYPPLNKSDFVDANMSEVICIMKNGRSGELIVNGKSFNKAMPAIPSLTNLEVAEITTYIYNTWDRKVDIVDVKTVDSILTVCKKQ